MAQLMLVSNPSKRRKSASKKTASRRRKSAKRKTSSRRSSRSLTFKRNPIRARSLMNRVLDQQLMPAAKQAAGALAVDVAFGYLGSFIPAQLSTGALRHVTKAAGAIVLSAIAANFVKSSTANEMAKGALTVTLHDAAKEMIAASVPGVPLGFYASGVLTPPARLGMFRRRSSLSMYESAGSNVMNFPTAMGAGRRGIGIQRR
jgi:hypothetical protein